MDWEKLSLHFGQCQPSGEPSRFFGSWSHATGWAGVPTAGSVDSTFFIGVSAGADTCSAGADSAAVDSVFFGRPRGVFAGSVAASVVGSTVTV